MSRTAATARSELLWLPRDYCLAGGSGRAGAVPWQPCHAMPRSLVHGVHAMGHDTMWWRPFKVRGRNVKDLQDLQDLHFNKDQKSLLGPNTWEYKYSLCRFAYAQLRTAVTVTACGACGACGGSWLLLQAAGAICVATAAAEVGVSESDETRDAACFVAFGPDVPRHEQSTGHKIFDKLWFSTAEIWGTVPGSPERWNSAIPLAEPESQVASANCGGLRTCRLLCNKTISQRVIDFFLGNMLRHVLHRFVQHCLSSVFPLSPWRGHNAWDSKTHQRRPQWVAAVLDMNIGRPTWTPAKTVRNMSKWVSWPSGSGKHYQLACIEYFKSWPSVVGGAYRGVAKLRPVSAWRNLEHIIPSWLSLAKWEKSAVKFSFKRCLTGLSILQVMAKELETETCESTKMCLAVDVLRVLGVATFSPFCALRWATRRWISSGPVAGNPRLWSSNAEHGSLRKALMLNDSNMILIWF